MNDIEVVRYIMYEQMGNFNLMMLEPMINIFGDDLSVIIDDEYTGNLDKICLMDLYNNRSKYQYRGLSFYIPAGEYDRLIKTI